MGGLWADAGAFVLVLVEVTSPPTMLSGAGLLICTRDENTKRPLPRRLQELVAQYPYTTSPGPSVDGLLTRPRFSTRRHDALFVRVEAVYADNVRTQPSRSPVGIFTDALKSESKSDSGEHVYLWDQVKVAVTADSDDRPLLAILSDDTINLLSLISADSEDQVLLGIPGAAHTLVTPLSPITESLLSATADGNGVPVPVRKAALPPSTPQSPKDWAEFSNAGFGEVTISKNFASTLLDKDLEVTEPPVERKLSKRKQGKSTTSTRTSGEFSSPVPPAAAPEEPEAPKLVLVATEVVQLDEAFVDFWRDAVVDQVSSDWPKFVVGELKHPLTPRSIPTSSEDGEKVSPGSPISWIIIEEKFKRPAPPPTPVIPPEPLTTSGLKVSATPLKRTSSPRPSFGDKKGSLSATFKRFTLFGGSKDDLAEDDSLAAGGGRKKAGASKSPKIGELGEVLPEEPEPLPEVPKKVDHPKKAEKETRKGGVIAAASGVVGGTTLPAPPQDDSPTEAGKDKVPVASIPELLTSPAPAPLVASTTEREVPAPVEEPGQAQKPLPGVPPVVEERPIVDELIPETVVDEPTPTAFPVKIKSQTLPPVPESIVSHGETPGPQLALDSTEAGFHHIPEPTTPAEEPHDSATERTDIPPTCDTEETADFGAQSPEPAIEHLEDKAEDPAADAGVDLDPVPIVLNDPVEPVEVEPEVSPEADTVDVTPAAPEPQPEPPATADEESRGHENVPVTEVPTTVLILEKEPKPEHTPVQDGGDGPTPLPPAQPMSSEPELAPQPEADVVPEGVPIDVADGRCALSTGLFL